MIRTWIPDTDTTKPDKTDFRTVKAWLNRYREAEKRYGENLDQKYNTGWGEQDFGGWDWDFNYALQKYVCGPMYEYFQAHPELGVTTFPKPNV